MIDNLKQKILPTHLHHPFIAFVLIWAGWMILRYLIFRNQSIFDGFFLIVAVVCIVTLFVFSAKSAFSMSLFYSLLIAIIVYLIYLAFVQTGIIDLDQILWKLR